MRETPPYTLMYLLGLHKRWSNNPVHPRLQALIEGPNALPVGRALDVGCGTGRDSVYVAKHGWSVTGIDLERLALLAARRRGAKEGVFVNFVRADLMNLAASGVKGPFDLFLDSGCFGALTDEQRRGYGQSLTEVSAPNASFLLGTLSRRLPNTTWKEGPLGADRVDIERSLGQGWEITQITQEDGIPRPPGNTGAFCYGLRRIPVKRETQPNTDVSA